MAGQPKQSGTRADRRRRIGLAGKVLAMVVLPIVAIAGLSAYAMFSANAFLHHTLSQAEARHEKTARIDRAVAGSKDSILRLHQEIAAMIEVHEHSLLGNNPSLIAETRRAREAVGAALDDFRANIDSLAGRIRASGLLDDVAAESPDPTVLRRRLGYLERSRVVMSRLMTLVSEVNDRTLSALKAGRDDRAVNNFLYEERARIKALKARLERMAEMIVALAAGIDEIQSRQAGAAQVAAHATAAERTTYLLIGVGICVVAVTILAASFALRRLARPFEEMIAAMRRLADGDMSAEIPRGGNDELGEMAHALDVFRSYAEEAERANRAKSDFLATMSHELRTPLNAIMGYAEVLRDEMMGPLGNPRYRGYASDIHRSGRHLLDLINDILDLSKVEAGRLEMTEQSVDLARLVEESLSLVGPQAKQKGLTLHVDTTGVTHSVRGDEKALKQIMLNLTWNAVKYTPAGGEVRVTARCAPHCEVTVRDTGPGIPEHEREHIFEPFARGKGHRSTEGTGIGLALSRRLAALHEAELLLESEVGAGTSVTLRFPDARVEPERLSEAVEPA